jgi:hypothetical protein
LLATLDQGDCGRIEQSQIAQFLHNLPVSSNKNGRFTMAHGQSAVVAAQGVQRPRAKQRDLSGRFLGCATPTRKTARLVRKISFWKKTIISQKHNKQQAKRP